MDTLDTGASLPPVMSGYTPERILGRGGSASVWLATRDADGARFAIKMVKNAEAPDGLTNPQGAAHPILREANILALARHEHLLRFHDVVPAEMEGQNAWGLVMEYAAGGSLANLVRGRRSLTVGEAVTVLTPLARALAFLHGQGIVHGDISPGNVLFTAHGKPLVADLGMAGLLGELQVAKDVGTPGFIDGDSAPSAGDAGRKAEEDAGLDFAGDVFALAALGWYCLAGVAPEPARSRPPLSLLVPDVPKGVVGALEAGLDPDPHARPNAKEFGSAIYRSAAPEPVDLVGSVHESVIPELLTRRPDSAHSTKRRTFRRFFNVPPTSWSKRTPTSSATRRTKARLMFSRLLPLPSSRPATPYRKARGPGARRANRSPSNVESSRSNYRSGRRRRTRTPARSTALVLGGCLVGLLAWIAWTGTGYPSQPGEPTRSAVPQLDDRRGSRTDILPATAQALGSSDPAVAVPALSAVRDQALAEGRRELLGLVNAPGSPAEEADLALARQLEPQGIRFVGLRTVLTGAAVDTSQADHAVVSLAAVLSGYEEQDAQGKVIRWQPPGQPQQLRLVLSKVDGQWRISEILGPEPG
ncbi:serine/threonine-protein kinase [Paenarthrobacter sp. NPDC089989]|uniref:serine/threonine-protein kinase n=1 Tax=unclassified Paenarthrobacter TaxID=2634190 RepID=UPI0037F862CD